MKRAYFKIVWDNIANFYTLVVFALIILLAVMGAVDYAFSSFIIFINIGIGIFQEIKAKKAVDKLELVSRSVYKVIRGGEELSLTTEEILAGDLVAIEAGQTVPADGFLTEGLLELDESILTGESASVRKNAGGKVLAGSAVKGGFAVITAEKVGDDRYIETAVKIAKEVHKPKSNIFRVLDKVIKMLCIGLVPLVLFLALSKLSNGSAGVDIAVEVASSILGMIPIGMFLLTSTTLAASVLKLSRKKTLLKDLYAIEMLATVDVLLLDKTGTMTTGSLRVAGSLGFGAYEGTRANDILFTAVTAGKSNNFTAKALLAYAGGAKLLPVAEEIPFSSDRKYSGAVFADGRKFVLGAPDFIIEGNAKLSEFAKENSEKCQRTLLLAEVVGGIENLADAKVTPIFAYALEDELRGDIIETMRWFAENDVQVKVVSGDECNTVSQTAAKTGLFGAEKCVNCNKIKEGKLEEYVEQTVIFGRSSPEQKAEIVKELQKNGHVVGMIGDGVNDILALKHADCSISFASASGAARDVSRIVMMDSDFTNMPRIVEEGRQVIGNIRKASSLFVMKNLFVMCMTLLFAILMFADPVFEYPFDSKKMMLMEFFVLGVPVFVLALSKNRERPQGTISQRIVQFGIPSAISLVAGVGVVFLYGFLNLGAGEQQHIASLAAITLTMSAFACLLVVARPYTKIPLITIIVMIGVSLLAIFLDGLLNLGILGIDMPNGIEFLIVIAGAAVSFFVAWGLRVVFRIVGNKRKKG